MITYRKMQITGTPLWDWLVSWVNLKYMRFVVTRVAWNEHLKTGREVHISEMFGSYVIYDSRDREDLNRCGKVNKMNIHEALRSSIWNSTAHSAMVKKRQIIEYPH